jgi:ATPase, P-type (transporting), HAD superfamily, subfamily IC/ATPase, P-type (transporting), HAD superfamily, subfamily IC
MQDLPYSMSKSALLEAFSTGERGLGAKEAQMRLETQGANVLEEGGKKTLLSIILSQFKNLMILVLLAAAVISALLSEVSDAVIIFAVILLNAGMGTVQESRAEAALEALKKLSAPGANVIRDGAVRAVKSAEVVPGDVVLLAAGDHVPADMRLISSASLRIDESMLTGESVPAEKSADSALPGDTPLAERVNMAYSGTSVVYGRGVGVVAATGMKTEIGKIAGALENAAEGETPLQKRMNSLSKTLSVMVLIIAAAIFGAGLLMKREMLDMFLVAVSLAVAAIPEGLATVVTLLLTMGVQKMSKNGAIIRKLPAVETLGSTSVICSDKTGTLTQNRMTVMKVVVNGVETDASGAAPSNELSLLERAFILCNDTQETAEGGEVKLTGDPTETALYAYAARRNEASSVIARYPRVFEVPFDSERKLMSTANGSDAYALYVKGAPDELILRCSHISLGGKILEMTPQRIKEIHEANAHMAIAALRVLAAAYKPLAGVPKSADGLESGLIFIGLAGMMDPPRAEVRDAVALCRSAGIRPVMITGDHKITAVAIAEKLGILTEGGRALSGTELDALSDEALDSALLDIGVYARVAPEHKVRIVKAFQSKGNVVAMTGDGVNDAPALKTAEIGVGMGITGTEVSKSASDMVLTDDNFATIVRAVEEGRRIFRNIKMAVQYLLSTNLSEVVTLLIGTLLGQTVLYPVQILWINLVTDTLPALAIGMEPAPKGIMRQKPRNANESFFAGGMAVGLGLYGAVMSALTLGIYFLSLAWYNDPEVSATMAFLTLGLVQLFHAFNIRAGGHTVFTGFWRNKWMHGAFALSALLQVIVVVAPSVASFFRAVPLNAQQWLAVLAASVAVVPAAEAGKAAKRMIKKALR